MGQNDRDLEHRAGAFERLCYGLGGVVSAGFGTAGGFSAYHAIDNVIESYRLDEFLDTGFYMFGGLFFGGIGLAGALGAVYLIGKAIKGKKISKEKQTL